MKDKSVTETRALFTATSFKYQTTTLGCHSCPKTMGAFALDATWLICTFHFSGNSSVKATGQPTQIRQETGPETRGWVPIKSAEGYAGTLTLSIGAMAVDNSE
jgi:hypothetical protein